MENTNPISWSRKVKIALDVACGMAYLHSRDIFFKVRTEYLVMDDKGRTKISEQFAHQHLNYTQGYIRWYTSDINNIAPEILLGQEYDKRQTDVYSYGMLLFEIITRRDISNVIQRPLNNGFVINEDDLRQRMMITGCPRHFLELGLLCIKYIPNKRPNFEFQIRTFLKKLLKIVIDMEEGERFHKYPPQERPSV